MAVTLDQALALLPPGPAWRAEPGTALRGLLEGLCGEFDRVEDLAAELLGNLDPRKAEAFLEDWERLLDISPAAGATVDERRLAAHARLVNLYAQHRSAFEALAAGLGYQVDFQRYQAFRAHSSCTSALTQWHWRYAVIVVTESGDNDALLESTLRSVTQAHTHLVFQYQ